jgi:cytochrome b pre-mRNA-processing protein 3
MTTNVAVGHAPLRRRSAAYRPWALVIAVLVTLALLAIVFAPSTGGEGRALLRMSPADRRALYDTTRPATEALCRQAEIQDALRKRCVSSAAFLLAFPECEASCRDFAHRFARAPAP